MAERPAGRGRYRSYQAKLPETLMTSLVARCPWCGYTACDADFEVHSSGHMAQTSPFRCLSCLASQAWPGDTLKLDAKESRLGWYRPGRHNPRISTLNGTHLTDHQARLVVDAGFAPGIPFYITLGEVDAIRAFELVD